MKKSSLLLAGLGFGMLIAVPVASAAKADGPKAKLLAKYDANKNGKLDPEEFEAVRKDFAANPKGDLARLDSNKDGKLSDEELAALVPGAGKKKSEDKAGKKGGGQKKDAAK